MNPATTLETAPASYNEHVHLLRDRFAAAMNHCELDSIVIASGSELPVYLDDQHYRFKPNPHFVQWLPLLDQPNAWLIITKDRKPQLIVLRAADFWHAAPLLPDDSYLQHFDVSLCDEAAQAHLLLAKAPGNCARICPDSDSEELEPLLNFLHFERGVKSSYEIACLREASNRGAKAHLAAYEAFTGGGSEFDIHTAFMRASRCSEHELPYPDIVACNENAATLHYQKRVHLDEPLSLLIDAGVSMNGYASDITRTYSREHNAFQALIDSVETLQQHLCSLVKPGISFGDLHHETHAGIANVLIAHDVISCDAEPAIKSGITSAFFPHGLGHFLGIQVHDVGGHMADHSGSQAPPPKAYPHLRMTRVLKPGMVLTVEPGIYFIDMLLNKLRDGDAGRYLNWPVIETFRPFGGIRIEDNLVITANGAENLTRNAFKEHV